VQIIEKGEMKKFFGHDQLHHAMEQKKVFLGFQEGFPMKFPPTFKVKRGVDTCVYEEKRSPAWCDRIVWRSFEGHKVAQRTYDYAPGITTSDHKPVFSTFELDRFFYTSGWDPDLGNCVLTIKNLEGENLPAGDINGQSDPFVEFYSPFIVGNRVCTGVIKQTLNPKWPDKEVHPLPLTLNRKQRLQDTVIFVRVFDWDIASAADLLCASVLHLRHGLEGKESKFTLELSKSGLPAGVLKGTMQIKWNETGTRNPKALSHSLLPQPSLTAVSPSK